MLLFAAAICLLAAVFWSGVAQRSPTAQRPNVLFIVIDSLRQDRLGVYSPTRRLTPFLDQLGASGVVYERAYSASSWTVPAVASIFLGRYPTQHHVARFFTSIPEQETTLAAAFAAGGYATSAVTANATTTSASGFDLGFERFELVGEPTVMVPKADGSLINESLLRMVDAVGADKPHFVFAHYMDVHSPYRAHAWTAERSPSLGPSDDRLNQRVMTGGWGEDAEQRRALWAFTPAEVERLEALYDGEVRQVDKWLRKLFRALDERGFLDRAIVVVTADHGEEFGKHGMFSHGTSLYEAAIRVPLIVRLPNRPPGRIEQPVQIAGLAATLLNELGIERPSDFLVPATPLSPLPPGASAYALSELVETKQMKIWLHEKALMRRQAKLLLSGDGDQQTFAIAEGHFGAPTTPLLSAELKAALSDLDDQRNGPVVAPAERDLDAATLERLRGLGYHPDRH